MTDISKNAQVSQCDKNDVKGRFFAQYWGQNVLGSTHLKNIKVVSFNYDLFGALNSAKGLIGATEAFKTYFLWLKPLSKITDEEAKQLPNREYNGFSKPYESANQFLILFELMGFLTSSEADILRKLGFLIPFENNSVDDLVSFGWVQLL